MPDSFLYFFPRMAKKGEGGYPILKVHLEGLCRFFSFLGGVITICYQVTDGFCQPPPPPPA